MLISDRTIEVIPGVAANETFSVRSYTTFDALRVAGAISETYL